MKTFYFIILHVDQILFSEGECLHLHLFTACIDSWLVVTQWRPLWPSILISQQREQCRMWLALLPGLFHNALCSEHLSPLQSSCTPPATWLSSTSLVPLGRGRAATALLILCLYEVQSNGNHQNRSVLAFQRLLQGLRT